ncbi:MAG: YicC family protein [Tissierellia bacterium]|nr:YicC family protein [Tissierellia bacterium]
MIKSMTGFGRGESIDGAYSFSVEIRSVNHRYNDIIVKMPKHINYLEEKIKAYIKGKINRGRVEVNICFEYIDDAALDVKVDIPLAKAYRDALDKLTDELNIEDDVNLCNLLNFPDIIKTERKDLNEDKIWNCLRFAIEEALNGVMDMRVKEGLVLKSDLETQLNSMYDIINKIEDRSSLVVTEYKNKLESRIKEILDIDCNIDEERLAYEVAFFADRSDINEEIIRLKSHIKQFLNSLTEKEPVGRKLDFIIQEMNREINTIGSKANDVLISNHVVAIKSQLEKMREQVQNIE